MTLVKTIHLKPGPLSASIWLALLALLALVAASGVQARPEARAWGTQPLLEHSLLSPGSLQALAGALNLDASKQKALHRIASQEAARLQALENASDLVLSRPDLSLAEKQAWVHRSAYNQQVVSILQESQERLQRLLGPDDYRRLAGWVEARWQQERRDLASAPAADHPAALQLSSLLAQPAVKSYPRSFEIWATRYDSGDRYVIALPDKCLKFANAGSLLCNDGYQYNQNYSVAISYNGKMVVAPVLESGPWNVDDNYWATSGDPQPRRMFADLPLGVPAAQAAYYNGYNGGLDQFGRVVKSPVAIDISWIVSKELDLPPGNTKVTISFLWTEGWDAPKSAEGEQGAQPVAPAKITWATSTPNPDGSLVHEVQTGQTLIGVATVYGIELNDLLSLNNLTMDSILQPGDRILIRPAAATPTPIPTSSPTAQPPSPTEPALSEAEGPTVSASPTVQPSPTSTHIPEPAAPIGPATPGWIIIAVAAACLLGAGLFLGAYIADKRR